MLRFPNRPNDFDFDCKDLWAELLPPTLFDLIKHNFVYQLWYPRFKRTTPTLSEFGGKSLNG